VARRHAGEQEGQLAFLSIGTAGDPVYGASRRSCLYRCPVSAPWRSRHLHLPETSKLQPCHTQGSPSLDTTESTARLTQSWKATPTVTSQRMGREAGRRTGNPDTSRYDRKQVCTVYIFTNSGELLRKNGMTKEKSGANLFRNYRIFIKKKRMP